MKISEEVYDSKTRETSVVQARCLYHTIRYLIWYKLYAKIMAAAELEQAEHLAEVPHALERLAAG
jgi:hypothetical protein